MTSEEKVRRLEAQLEELEKGHGKRMSACEFLKYLDSIREDVKEGKYSRYKNSKELDEDL